MGMLGNTVEATKPAVVGSKLKSEEDIVSSPNFYYIELLDAKPSHGSIIIRVRQRFALLLASTNIIAYLERS